jgi:TfoX/Sxy family transcriptional regulator of competence genes
VTPEERFEAVAAEHDDPDVTRATMFGSPGLKVNGKVFACFVKGKLVVKLPAERVDALTAAGKGKHFDPGMGRVMREWVALEPDDEWPARAAESRGYVISLIR